MRHYFDDYILLQLAYRQILIVFFGAFLFVSFSYWQLIEPIKKEINGLLSGGQKQVIEKKLISDDLKKLHQQYFNYSLPPKGGDLTLFLMEDLSSFLTANGAEVIKIELKKKLEEKNLKTYVFQIELEVEYSNLIYLLGERFQKKYFSEILVLRLKEGDDDESNKIFAEVRFKIYMVRGEES